MTNRIDIPDDIGFWAQSTDHPNEIWLAKGAEEPFGPDTREPVLVLEGDLQGFIRLAEAILRGCGIIDRHNRGAYPSE